MISLPASQSVIIRLASYRSGCRIELRKIGPDPAWKRVNLISQAKPSIRSSLIWLPCGDWLGDGPAGNVYELQVLPDYGFGLTRPDSGVLLVQRHHVTAHVVQFQDEESGDPDDPNWWVSLSEINCFTTGQRLADHCTAKVKDSYQSAEKRLVVDSSWERAPLIAFPHFSLDAILSDRNVLDQEGEHAVSEFYMPNSETLDEGSQIEFVVERPIAWSEFVPDGS